MLTPEYVLALTGFCMQAVPVDCLTFKEHFLASPHESSNDLFISAPTSFCLLQDRGLRPTWPYFARRSYPSVNLVCGQDSAAR